MSFCSTPSTDFFDVDFEPRTPEVLLEELKASALEPHEFLELTHDAPRLSVRGRMAKDPLLEARMALAVLWRSAAKHGVHEALRARHELSRQLDGLGDRRIARDAGEPELIRAETEQRHDGRVDRGELPLCEPLDRVVDPKPPAKHAENERADEIAILDSRLTVDRHVGLHRPLVDSSENPQRPLAVVHASLAPAARRAPRA